MSNDAQMTSKAVAEELALEHCSFYADKPLKVAKGFFLNQLYRSWGLTAHRGWARLLLDRRCLAHDRPVQTKTTMKRARWNVTSTLKLATTPAPSPNRAPV